MSKICIVGDILIDITLKTENNPLKMRLGGIVHAARGLWAMGIEYSIGYFAPSYLDKHITDFLSQLNCSEIIKIGNVGNCPYTMLIEEVKEIGDQGYEFILRDDIQISYNDIELQKLNQFDDIFLISGNYEYCKVISNIPYSCKTHYDIANNIDELSFFKGGQKLETIFISTSSPLFKASSKVENFNIEYFFNQFEELTEKIILKENRGGSRAYNFAKKQLISIPAQTQKIIHSVGVGDVYDSCYVALYRHNDFQDTLNYSSWIATEYAKTTFPDDFKKMALRVLKTNTSDIALLGGCLLPWEIRTKGHIYIAAPDFDFVNTKLIDLIEKNLLYHNFSPHRPIKENGQMEVDASITRKQELFKRDLELLNRCNMLIAILLYNDPGTLIEIGIAAERKIPTFVFDPYNIAKNCMLTQLPDLITADFDELLSEVFRSYNKILS